MWKGIEMVLMAEAFEELVRGLEHDGRELTPLALPLHSAVCSFNSLAITSHMFFPFWYFVVQKNEELLY